MSSTPATGAQVAPLAIPRIVPPHGERLPLHGQPVEPLPLEPSVVPLPPIDVAAIPRMPRPIAKPAAVKPELPAYCPVATVGSAEDDATYPATPDGQPNIPEQVLWCLARFEREQVTATWSGSFTPQVFQDILARFDKETKAYATALEAWEKAQASSAPATEAAPVQLAPAQQEEAKTVEPEVTPADLAAIHADAPALAGVQAAPAEPKADGAVKRRLTAGARQACVEAHAQGKDKLEIAQLTGLPMELVDRALADLPPVQTQSAAAEKAYQQTLAQQPESSQAELEARAAATRAIAQQITLPNSKWDDTANVVCATLRLERGLAAYVERSTSLADALRDMRDDIDTLLARE